MTETSKGGRRSLMISLVLAGLAVALIGPAQVAAGGGPLTTFEFELNESGVHGYGAPPNADIKVVLRGPDGSFQGSFVNTTGGDGSWGWDYFWGDINSGDKLIATVGSMSRTFVVPPLQYAINRVTDVVSGKTAANSSVYISLRECQAEWWDCDFVTERYRPTNSTGNFSTDFTSTYNIRGGDELFFQWQSPQNDYMWRYGDAPQLSVGMYDNEAWGIAKPNTDVKVWLFNSQGTEKAKFKDHGDFWDGDFYGKFSRNGKAVDVLPGDFVGSDFASDALWKVFNINPQFNTAADTINAKCWKNKPFYVYGENINNSGWFEVTGVTDGNGNISINTTNYNSFDLRSDDTIEIDCRNSLGDEQESLFEVP